MSRGRTDQARVSRTRVPRTRLRRTTTVSVGSIGISPLIGPQDRRLRCAEPGSVVYRPTDIFITHVSEYPAKHQHVRGYRVAVCARVPCVGLTNIDTADASCCDASACDADIVVVGLDEQCVHFRLSRVTLQHADDVVPCPAHALITRIVPGGAWSIASVRRFLTAIRRCERSDSGSSYASCQVAQYERVDSFVAIG